jgi:hypothetical protein
MPDIAVPEVGSLWYAKATPTQIVRVANYEEHPKGDYVHLEVGPERFCMLLENFIERFDPVFVEDL